MASFEVLLKPIYFFILAVLSLLLHFGFLQVQRVGATLPQNVWASLAVEHGLWGHVSSAVAQTLSSSFSLIKERFNRSIIAYVVLVSAVQ